MAIAGQRIRLPRALCVPYKQAERTLDAVERDNALFEEWRQSPWLRGELILLLDEDNTVELNGYCLAYDRESGLRCTKEDVDGREGI